MHLLTFKVEEINNDVVGSVGIRISQSPIHTYR